MTIPAEEQRSQCDVCSAMVPGLLMPLHNAWHEDDDVKPVTARPGTGLPPAPWPASVSEPSGRGIRR